MTLGSQGTLGQETTTRTTGVQALARRGIAMEPATQRSAAGSPTAPISGSRSPA